MSNVPATERSAPLSVDFLSTVSHSPGVYQMLGKTEVLYVGKARDLRKRLAQYAHFKGSAHSKTAVMLSHLVRVETILTTTEKEALILEASLIKKHRPRYNVILRDDKNYPLIKVTTNAPWPRVIVTRKRIRDGSKYFGPFSSTTAMRSTLKLLYSQFPLRRCKTMRERERPCLNYQMGRCLAPCAGKVSSKEYQDMVREVVLILEGNSAQVITSLEQKMINAAAAQAFEKAAMFRDQIRGLKKTLEHQAIVADHHLDQDIFGLCRQKGSIGIAMLFVRAGMVTGAQTFFLEDPMGPDASILTQTILQYYSLQRQPPREILLPVEPTDQQLVEERLHELRQGPVRLVVPQRGKRMQLMRMAASNAEQVFSEQAKKDKSWKTLANALCNKIKLSNIPTTIECLDISNLQGQQAIGSLVSFVKGEKYPAKYRHYRIRSQDTPDDYAMMREVLNRRFVKGISENNLPDLLLLDGGKGQLNIGVAALEEHNLVNAIDLVAIAKEKQDEGEKIFRPGRKNPILLPAHSPSLLYFMEIRDEAHRFGITLHRKLRRKSNFMSQLDDISGIGPQRKKQLLRTLGSFKRIKAASIEELSQVPGVGPELAQAIHHQLHGEPDAA